MREWANAHSHLPVEEFYDRSLVKGWDIDDWIRLWEYERRHGNLKLNEGMDLFKENIDEISDALTANIIATLDRIDSDFDDPMFPREGEAGELTLEVKRLVIENEIGDMQKRLKRVETKIRHRDFPDTSMNSITDSMILRAKDYPISNLYDGKLTNGRVRKGLCPFHTEKTPSFVVYESKNRFKCFGCLAGGDAIDFYQKLNGTSFPETVRALNNQ